jgi:hypothetical protein
MVERMLDGFLFYECGDPSGVPAFFVGGDGGW